MANIWLDILP